MKHSKDNTIHATANVEQSMTYNKITDAVGHTFIIVMMSIAMVLIINEIFNGSKITTLIAIIIIAAYVTFSFARKYWVEKRQKKIMEAIDITMTLVGGLFLIIIYNAEYSDNYVGHALAKNIVSSVESQPHIGVFYLGVVLLIVGAIRIFMLNNKSIHTFKDKF